MKIALCPGSYDPLTKGHINIVSRAAQVFDQVIVVVMVNTAKQSTFTIEERLEMLRLSLQHMPNVQVEAFNGLVAECARQKGAQVLVKGLRAVTDFEYEFQMALMNKKLNPLLETMFITADDRFLFLSSSSVREIASFGGDISDFVPACVRELVQERLRKKDDV